MSGRVQGMKGMPILNEPREEEHARVRGHLMHALNVNTVTASIGQLSETVQRSIAAITLCAADGLPEARGHSARPAWMPVRHRC